MKKVFYYIGFVTLGSVLTLQSCYYDKLNELKINVNNSCDTTSIPTYNNVLIVLNNNNCTNADCHGSDGGTSGVPLNNYANVKRVSLNGRILGALNHNGYNVPMPSPNVKIKQCEIDLIQRWVDNNCLEN